MKPKIFLRLSLLLGLVLLLSCSAKPPVQDSPRTAGSIEESELERWVKQASRVSIIRDDFGVAHIYGESDADTVFGLLYAQCEDDFFRVERNYLFAIGKLAEVEGEDALYSDLRARLFMTREEAIAHYETAPAWLQKLCMAFADGINYFLHTHPEIKPKGLERFEPWMPMYFSEGSIGGDIERVSQDGIRDFYKKGTDIQAVASNQRSSDEEPRGSNGIAVSGKLTESGHAMLLINPHTTFFFRGEYHVVSEEDLNAYGAITWGQFFIYQGFNEKTGWMHTSTYTDVIDEYLETVTEKNGELVYKYGGEERSVKTIPVTLKFLDGDKLQSKSFTMYRTHHGPVTHKVDGQWVSTALMWEPVKALTQSYTRTKQSGHAGFREMMDIRTNSSNNTVYADAEGNIAYYHGNFIPKRDTSFDFSKPVDGSNPKTDWQGLHTVDESIVVLNPPTGWIQNCNSTPYTSAGKYSPNKSDFPNYMSIDRENFRGIHAISLLEKAEGLNMEKMISLAHDPYVPGFEPFVEGLVRAYEKHKSKYRMLKEPIELISKWDLKVSVDSAAMSLMHYYATSVRQQDFPEAKSILEKFYYHAKHASFEKQLDLLVEVVTKLDEDFGKWQTPWGEINRYQRLTGDYEQVFDDTKPSIPIGMASGRWGALASFGAKASETTKRIYGRAGNSFVAVVEFGPKVKAKTMLAGGQSADPGSPHFDDQARPYANIQFKDAAYYREDVEKRARATYHPGQKP